jgi:hypothetical protein
MTRGSIPWAKLVFLALMLARAASAHAQASPIILRQLSMPPPKEFAGDVFFGTLGQVDSRPIANYSDLRSEDTNSARNFAYTRYTAPLNSILLIHGEFDTPIPDATYVPELRDSCHHSHLEFAVYAKAINWTGGQWIPAYSFAESAGMIGRRMLNNTQVKDGTPGATCVVNNAPDRIYDSSEFIWGPSANTFTFYDFPFQKWTEAILATQGVAHGWGGCGRFTCFPQVRAIAARVQ